MKIVLGLSGGVDSAVSARLLLEAGWDVTGVYLDNGQPGADAAREAAAALGIPLAVRDIRAALEENVCAPFAAGYLRGETPNPCVLCNRTVKFPFLCAEADRLGAEKIATGHYARAEGGALYKGRPANDQSYMLCRVTPQQAARLVLPLGRYEKTEVRALAASWGLAVASRPDSMEICFIPDGDYAGYIERRGVTPPPGDFLMDGRCVGRHRGIHRYTLGQRRRLGITVGRRVYVSAIRPDSNEIVLAEGEDVWTDHIRVRDVSWLAAPAAFPLACSARVRHSRTETPDVLVYGDGCVRFLSPVRAPTPGQAAAFYDGDRLLGGGFIEN